MYVYQVFHIGNAINYSIQDNNKIQPDFCLKPTYYVTFVTKTAEFLLDSRSFLRKLESIRYHSRKSGNSICL